MNDKDTYRMHTKVIQIGDRKIGGGNPIAIQSMTNTKTEDVKATVERSCVWRGQAVSHPLHSTDAGGGALPGDQEADPHSFSGGYPF